jgi:hypothetical protein
MTRPDVKTGLMFLAGARVIPVCCAAGARGQSPLPVP